MLRVSSSHHGVFLLLATLLQDEDRLQTATNEAPTLDGFNRQLARGHAEYELFTRLDREAHWPGELYTPQEVRPAGVTPSLYCYRGAVAVCGGVNSEIAVWW